MNVHVHLIYAQISWKESMTIILYYDIVYSFGGRKTNLHVHLIYAHEYHGKSL